MCASCRPNGTEAASSSLPMAARLAVLEPQLIAQARQLMEHHRLAAARGALARRPGPRRHVPRCFWWFLVSASGNLPASEGQASMVVNRS